MLQKFNTKSSCRNACADTEVSSRDVRGVPVDSLPARAERIHTANAFACSNNDVFHSNSPQERKQPVVVRLYRSIHTKSKVNTAIAGVTCNGYSLTTPIPDILLTEPNKAIAILYSGLDTSNSSSQKTLI